MVIKFDFEETGEFVPVGAINVTRIVEPDCTETTTATTTAPAVATFDKNTIFVNSNTFNEGFKLEWNYTEDDITFRVTTKTSNGWVGFGLSPTGKMWNSNFFMAWPKADGTGIEFRDASAVYYNVIYDRTQNWKQLFYQQADGETTVIATRKNKISASMAGASNVDVADQSKVVYAWGSGFNDGGLPTYHFGQRGSQKVGLLSGQQ